jgi:hypothetical protein
VGKLIPETPTDTAAQATDAPPPGFNPVPVAHHTRATVHENSTIAHASGFRTVFLYLLADAFDLTDSEILWAGYHLDTIFAPLLDQAPHAVPLAVKREVFDGTYTRLMELRSRARLSRADTTHDPNVLQATADEWADMVMEQVTSCYSLRPITESAMRGHLIGLLTELGVGTPDNPRGATFLPTDLRLKILNQSQRD